jgi:hypothetical protein
MVVSFAAVTARADGDQQSKKRGHGHRVRGVVTEVKRDADKDNGSITVRVQQKKKAGTTDHDQSRTFQVLPVTKFVKAKGKGQSEPGSFKDVHEGEHVVVQSMDDRPGIAQVVAIHHKGKK